ncbi:GA-binding protein subunit beta-1-like isoform X2 [Euwallacea similis]
MKRHLEEETTNVRPIKYILTADNKLQALPDIEDHSIAANSSFVSQTLQTINKLGKHLLEAAKDGDPDKVKALLSQGSPFTSDWLGTTPLHLAAQNNNLKVCEVVLKGGISQDARNKVDRTPLHLAAYEGNYQVAEMLIKYGADINTADMLHMTPLHWAVQNGHTAVVELLVRNGACTTSKNKFNLTPQDIANQINKLELVELLQAYEGDAQAASQALVMQLQEDDEVNNVIETAEENCEGKQTSDPVIVIDDESLPPGENIGEESTESSPENPCSVTTTEEDGDFSAMKLLQEHGITMLPIDSDESNILNAVMESGHSVVLTDVGKEVLKTVKQQEEKVIPKPNPPKRTITVTLDQFLALTKGNFIQNVLPNNLKVISGRPNIRRVVMKKNKKPTPFGNNLKVQSIEKSSTELDLVLEELEEAKRTIEEYKSKLKKKEDEVEKYKYQLKLLKNNS